MKVRAPLCTSGLKGSTDRLMTAALAQRGENVDDLQRAADALYATVDSRANFSTQTYLAALARLTTALEK